MNFCYILKNICEKYPEKIAVIDRGNSYSYRVLWSRISRVSELFNDYGVKKSDRIIIVLPDSIDFLLYHFAALKIGAISVPVKRDYKIWEFEKILQYCRPKLFISNDEWLETNKSVIKTLKPEVRIISTDSINIDGKRGDMSNRVMNTGDISCILHSYFGCGYPKGVALSHKNLIISAIGYSKYFNFSSMDMVLVVLPMSHVYTLSGCIHSTLVRGATIVIPETTTPKTIIKYIKSSNITILTAVPAVFEYLSRYCIKKNYDISTIRLCISGGDYLSADMQIKFEKCLNKQIIQGYGLTESMPVVSNVEGKGNRPGALGIPGRKDIKIKIINETGKEIPMGQTGEILIKSPTIMSEYYNLPHDTKAVLKGGWLHTGDIGWVNNDGFLYFSGLKKNIFNLYGNKVDPLEVKMFLLTHPLIDDAEIYMEKSTPSSKIIGTMKICANIKTKQGGKISVIELRAFCKERIASYKIPESFKFI